MALLRILALPLLFLAALARAQSQPSTDEQFFGAECFREGPGGGLVLGGQEISTSRGVRNPNACQVVCAETETCAYFNFYSDGGFCVLFDSFALAEGVSGPGRNGVTFGPRVCDCYIRPSRRFKPGIVSPINGPSFDAASSPMDCQATCQSTAGCQYFEYEAVEAGLGRCMLYDSDAIDNLFSKNYERDTAFTSGPRSCVGCFTTGSAIVDEVNGVDTVDRPIGSAVYCQFLCFRSDKFNACTGINYFPETKVCQLYYGDAEPPREPNANAMTGPPICDV